jgi:D-alanyl-D-alanine endopeptidase (penicillin-binding protein 7)
MSIVVQLIVAMALGVWLIVVAGQGSSSYRVAAPEARRRDALSHVKPSPPPRFAFPREEGFLGHLTAPAREEGKLQPAPTPSLATLRSAESVPAAARPSAPSLEKAPPVPPPSLPFLLRNAQSGFSRAFEISPPVLGSTAAIVTDIESGEPLFALRSGKRWPLASLTKLMSAAVALERMGEHAVVTISPSHASETVGNTPQDAILKVGDRFKVKDIVAMMLLASSNEAAETLADFYGRAHFIAAMNEKAREWGMDNTHFDEPTGLSAANQSTAKDLHVMVKQMFAKHREIFDITTHASWTATEVDSKAARVVPSINLFAGTPSFLGGKTGYTDEAQGNLLSVFSHDGRAVVVVVLGTHDRFGETKKLYEWFTKAFSARPAVGG